MARGTVRAATRSTIPYQGQLISHHSHTGAYLWPFALRLPESPALQRRGSVASIKLLSSCFSASPTPIFLSSCSIELTAMAPSVGTCEPQQLPPVMEAALVRLKKASSAEDQRQFKNTDLRDVWNSVRDIEKETQKRKFLRGIGRVEPLLKAIANYSPALDTLANGTPYLPWIWVSSKPYSLMQSCFEPDISCWGPSNFFYR